MLTLRRVRLGVHAAKLVYKLVRGAAKAANPRTQGKVSNSAVKRCKAAPGAKPPTKGVACFPFRAPRRVEEPVAELHNSCDLCERQHSLIFAVFVLRHCCQPCCGSRWASYTDLERDACMHMEAWKNMSAQAECVRHWSSRGRMPCQ